MPQQLGEWVCAIDLTRLLSGWFIDMTLAALRQCFLVWCMNNKPVGSEAENPARVATGRAAMGQLQHKCVQQHLSLIMCDVAKRLSGQVVQVPPPGGLPLLLPPPNESDFPRRFQRVDAVPPAFYPIWSTKAFDWVPQALSCSSSLP